MGNSIARFFRREVQRRILMVGLDAGGKTTILYKLKLGDVVTTIPTIGFNVETVTHKNINMTCWDVGGRCKMRTLYRHYYAHTDALIYVIDSNDHERFDIVKDEIHRMASEDALKNIPILIFCNKQDLPRSKSPAEIADKLGLHAFRNRKWYTQACCATQGDGLYAGLDWLASQFTGKNKRVDVVKNNSTTDTFKVAADPHRIKKEKKSLTEASGNTITNKMSTLLRCIF